MLDVTLGWERRKFILVRHIASLDVGCDQGLQAGYKGIFCAALVTKQKARCVGMKIMTLFNLI